MKPTISNAFNDDSKNSAKSAANSPKSLPKPAPDPNFNPNSWEFRKPDDAKPAKRNPRKSLAASLASMEIDLRDADFGYSLELSPMQAADAVQACNPENKKCAFTFLVNMEQSTWRDEQGDTSISDIAARLCIPVIEKIAPDQLVMSELGLRQLVSLCQPTRLLIVAVDGPLDAGDVAAINKAVAAGKSPLLAEVRASFAMEVMGDRSVVLHCRDRSLALIVAAENFRHYLAALSHRRLDQLSPPQPWHLERLLSLTGTMTIRPIETQVFSTSIDVGINTSRERATRPADRSLIYDTPSDTWHDEP